MIAFSCPKCQATLKAPDDKAGARSKCPYCSCPVQVPRSVLAEDVAEFLPADPPVLDRRLVARQKEVLDVLPADDVPVLEEVKSESSRPPLDPTGRFYLCECLACQRPLRIPIAQRGCISRCPSCRLFFRVWGRLRPGVRDGLPITLRVSAYLLQWPTACACCLRPHDDFLKVRHFHQTNLSGTEAVAALAVLAFQGKAALEEALPHNFWEVPYCWDCLEHVKTQKKWDMHEGCSVARPAVAYQGLQGSVHTFRFYNWQYANRFLLLNHDKCLI